MAFTVVASPDQVHPAYNPVVYWMSGDNPQLPGYRYIIDIYPAGTLNLFRQLKIAPRPNDYLGYADISKIIQARIGTAIPPFDLANFTEYDGEAKLFKYDIQFGEEYYANWDYTDYGFATGGLTAFTGLAPHPYVVGDQIRVRNTTQNYGDCRDALNGFFTVVDVPNANTLTINLPFPCSNAVTPGTITYADNRNIVLQGQAVLNDRIAFDRAYNTVGFKNYTSSAILATPAPSTASILTDAPKADFTVKPFQHLTWPFFDNDTNNQAYIWFKTDNGSTYRNNISSIETLKMVAVGPGNTNPVAIGLAPTWDTVIQTAKWYDVFTTDSTTVTDVTSETRRIYLDQDCCKNEIELVFLDRAGAYSSYAFCLNAFERGTVERTNYRKELGDLNAPNPFEFNTWDSGLTTFNVRFNTQYTLNTDWMTDGMSVYFNQLITSPEVFAKLVDDEGNNVWYRCIVQENSFETQRKKNKNLIRKTVTIQLAINDSINV